MTPEDRRAALVAATVPLLRTHGRAVTTRMIADAADVAEGTIFRVFETKDDLVEAAITASFDHEPFLADLAAIDRTLPLRDRLVAFVTVLQDRFVAIFGLMHTLGLVAPPENRPGQREAWRVLVRQHLADLFTDADAEALRLPTDEVIHVLRLLTFSGSHDQITHGRLLSPDLIVDVVLDGVRTPTPRKDR